MVKDIINFINNIITGHRKYVKNILQTGIHYCIKHLLIYKVFPQNNKNYVIDSQTKIIHRRRNMNGQHIPEKKSTVINRQVQGNPQKFQFYPKWQK